MLQRVFICIFACLLSAPIAQAEGKSIIVLDASGSMWGQIDGRPKLEIAREALATVLATVPPDTELGLIAYGHREKGSCADIELLVPPGPGTGPAIAAAANGMSFLGKTPLTEAVREAAAALRSTEEKATVILITDGIETCNADPCALGRELEASGVDFTAHVVGFGLTADEGRQVACLAENTGGLYIEAKDAGTLAEALETTVASNVGPAPEPAPAPPPEPPKPAALDLNLAPSVLLAPGGPKFDVTSGPYYEVFPVDASGTVGSAIVQRYDVVPLLVEPGRYLVRVTKDQAVAESDVTVTADVLATPELVLNAGYLTVRPLGFEGGPVEDGASVTLRFSDGRETGDYGAATRLLPAGDIGVTVQVGQATATLSIPLAAGASITQDVIAASGVAVINTFYVEGMSMEDIGQSVTILAGKQSLDGGRETVTGGYGDAQAYTLPPGDYVARVEMGLAATDVPFAVKAGERVEIAAVVNAGVLFATAAEASAIELFAAKKDIQGNLRSMRFQYGDTLQVTTPPGDYIVRATRGDVVTEAPVTVTAGERSEVTVP